MASLQPPRTVRVLSLDGGGVRGLSSLYIIQEVLRVVDMELREMHSEIGIPFPGDPLLPSEVFDFVVGTSTGGLIAIMITKLNMSVTECIQAYENMARRVFGRKSLIGRLCKGFCVPLYSGTEMKSCVTELLKSHRKKENAKMEDGNLNPVCSVVSLKSRCDEPTRRGRTEPYFLCSHECRNRIRPYKYCEIWEAARATSAATTYFRPLIFHGMILKDGGVGNNNPSTIAYRHYRRFYRQSGLFHQGQVVWLNVGTGSKTTAPPPCMEKRRRGFVRRLPVIKDIIETARELKEAALDTDNAGFQMEDIAEGTANQNEMGRQRLRFTRLSANNGVPWIKLDDHQAVTSGRIRKLTEEFLGTPDATRKIQEIAHELATETFQRRLQAHRLRRNTREENAREFNLVTAAQPDPAAVASHLPDLVVTADGTHEETASAIDRLLPPLTLGSSIPRSSTDFIPSSAGNDGITPPAITDDDVGMAVVVDNLLPEMGAQFATSPAHNSIPLPKFITKLNRSHTY